MDQKTAIRLGQHLRQARETLGMSAVQVADIAEVSDSNIIRIENGKLKNPTAETLAKLAHALNLSVADIFERAGFMTGADLPTMAPYLRTKYDMPPEALEQIERYAKRVAKKHGIDMNGPNPGQDETP